MTEIAELHARALDATGRIVDDVAADRWHAAGIERKTPGQEHEREIAPAPPSMSA
jgi:hypothetical protein